MRWKVYVSSASNIATFISSVNHSWVVVSPKHHGFIIKSGTKSDDILYKCS